MKINHTKVYGILGKIMCGCGGAIVGFVTSLSMGAAILGVFIGVAAGHLLERALANPLLNI